MDFQFLIISTNFYCFRLLKKVKKWIFWPCYKKIQKSSKVSVKMTFIIENSRRKIENLRKKNKNSPKNFGKFTNKILHIFEIVKKFRKKSKIDKKSKFHVKSRNFTNLFNKISIFFNFSQFCTENFLQCIIRKFSI